MFELTMLLALSMAGFAHLPYEKINHIFHHVAEILFQNTPKKRPSRRFNKKNPMVL